MKRTWISFCFVMAALVGFLPASVMATEYFVATNGVDTADGTNWPTAFATIPKALAQCVDGNIYMTGSTVTNSIVMFNDAGTSGTNYGGTATFAYSCADADGGGAPTGIGNICEVSFLPGTYQLEPLTFAINGGINLPWMVGAMDLAGAERIQGGTVDMGCYEGIWNPAGTVIIVR